VLFDLIKYANDTYVIIPACNVDSRQLEMDHIGEWAERNNLVLNRSKSAEIVFTDSRKRRPVVPTSPLTDIARVQSLKVLGVTISSSLSLSEHVNKVISSCACSQYAIKVLRVHGLYDTASQEVYKSVVVGKLLYASPAWWGFASATDRQRVDAVLRRGVRSGLYPSQQTANGIVGSADDRQTIRTGLTEW